MAVSKDSTDLGTSKANERAIVVVFSRTSSSAQQHFLGLNNKTFNRYYESAFKLKLQTMHTACLVMLSFSFSLLAINRSNTYIFFFRREKKLYI